MLRQRALAALQQGQLGQAEGLYRQLLAAGVEDAPLLSNLSVICWQSGRYGEMEQLLRRALRHEPQNADVHYNLALVLAQGGGSEAAIHHYRQALATAPERLQGSVHWNLSKLLLRRGDYAAGWQSYSWRTRKAQPLPPICQPAMAPWDGRPQPDGDLMLVGEQGLGDMLQFLRYAPLMRRFAGRVSLCLPEKLLPLVAGSSLGVELRSPAQAMVQADGHWLPLLSAPLHLGVRPESVLVEAPYLQVPAERIHHWRRRLRAELAPGERLVALHWQGNPATETSELRGRSLPLQALAPLAEQAGLRFVALQKGPGSEQLADCPFSHRFVANQAEVDATWDFIETGAIARSCDLVISSDSALVHLAGALGVPTWVLLHHSSDWRWGESGERTFWYPSVQLFRQRRPGDWTTVISETHQALRAWLTPTTPSATPATTRTMNQLLIPGSIGELIDKVTILEIKEERLEGAALANVQRELALLRQVLAQEGMAVDAEMQRQLREVNETLWDIEDRIRLQEQRQDFGATFIELARAVYRTNDRRAALKRQINEACGSLIVEEKSYQSYD